MREEKIHWLMKLDSFCMQPLRLSFLIAIGVQSTVKSMNKVHGGNNPSLAQCIPWRYPPILGRGVPVKNLGKINADRLLNLTNLSQVDDELHMGNLTQRQREDRLKYGNALRDLMEVAASTAGKPLPPALLGPGSVQAPPVPPLAPTADSAGNWRSQPHAAIQRANQRAAMQHHNARLMMARERLREAEKRVAMNNMLAGAGDEGDGGGASGAAVDLDLDMQILTTATAGTAPARAGAGAGAAGPSTDSGGAMAVDNDDEGGKVGRGGDSGNATRGKEKGGAPSPIPDPAQLLDAMAIPGVPSK
jgi:hypothetical protein